MMWHRFDIFMICTDIPNHPYKELSRDAEREKMWHESVRGLESGRETRLVRMWSERSEYEMRRWDRSWDQVCHPHTPRPGVRVCWSGAPERVTPHFCLSRYLHRQANAIVCRQTEVFAPPLLERFTTISIFGVLQVGDDDLGKGMPRINWVMQIVEKKTQTDRISADRVAEEIRSALISWLSQKHRSVINFKRELQYLTRMDGITFSKLEDLARLANNVY